MSIKPTDPYAITDAGGQSPTDPRMLAQPIMPIVPKPPAVPGALTGAGNETNSGLGDPLNSGLSVGDGAPPIPQPNPTPTPQDSFRADPNATIGHTPTDPTKPIDAQVLSPTPDPRLLVPPPLTINKKPGDDTKIIDPIIGDVNPYGPADEVQQIGDDVQGKHPTTPTNTSAEGVAAADPHDGFVGHDAPPQDLPSALTPVVPPPPVVNAGNIAGIDPTNDLRSSSVLPGEDPALQKAIAGEQNATSAIDNFDRQKVIDSIMEKAQSGMPTTSVTAGAGVDPNASDRLKTLQGQVDTSAAGLAGVDRNKMALDLYQQFIDAQAPQDFKDRRRATQDAAATGGLRSGRLRTAYGDLDLAKENARGLERRRLMSDALNGSIQDQFNKTNALSGLEGQVNAQEAGQRGEQRTERGYTTDVNTGNVTRGLNAFQSNRSNANAGADAAANDLGARVNANRATFGDVAGESRAQRNEVRGERTNQNDMETQAFQRRLAQYNAEQAAKNTKVNQGISLLGAGESGNPASTLERLASEGGLDPAMIAQLAQSLGNKGGSTSGGSGGPDIASIIQNLLKSKGLDTMPDSGQVSV